MFVTPPFTRSKTLPGTSQSSVSRASGRAVRSARLARRPRARRLSEGRRHRAATSAPSDEAQGRGRAAARRTSSGGRARDARTARASRRDLREFPPFAVPRQRVTCPPSSEMLFRRWRPGSRTRPARAAPELDRAFEAALADARERDAEPLAHLVAGRDVTAGEPFAREDPSRREHVASRAHEGAEVVAEAVEAASRSTARVAAASARGASRGPARDRAADRRAQARLAAAISLEVGKVRTESIAEVEEAIDLIETYCRQIESAEGFETPLGRLAPDERNTDVLRPYGVFGVIAPFNFPFALGFGMTAAALASGQRRGPEATGGGAGVGRGRRAPARRGRPPGRSHLARPRRPRDRRGAGRLARSTASRSPARPRSAARSGGACRRARIPRPVLAEMGGKNAAVVGASADLEAAAEGIARAAFGFSGQKCSACSRAIVVDEVHDELRRAARRASPRPTHVGDPADPDAATGPVVNGQAVERFERSGRGGSPRRRRRGRRLRATTTPGWFVEPTVVCELAAGPSADARRALPARSSPWCASPTSTPRSPRRTPSRTGSRPASSRGTTDELDRFLDEIEAGVVYVNRRAGATTGAWPGHPVLLRLEVERPDRQGRPRSVLRAAVRARAEPDDRGAVTASRARRVRPAIVAPWAGRTRR